MLSPVTWQQYLAAVAIGAILYYGYVLLKYYREELAALFQRNVIPEASITGAAPGNLMSPAKQDAGESFIASEDLQFPDADGSQATSELLSEIKSLINTFSGIDNKEEFLSLLGLLFSRYHAQEADQATVFEGALEAASRLPFLLSREDLLNTWDKE